MTPPAFTSPSDAAANDDLPALPLPEAAVLVAGVGRAAVLDTDGAVESLSLQEARRLAAEADERPPILCHGPAAARRLGCDPFPCYDLLELFAFCRPAEFCVPTPAGLAGALGLAKPAGLDDAPLALLRAMQALLHGLARRRHAEGPEAARLAMAMARGGWPWGPAVLAALGDDSDPGLRAPTSGLDVWRRLPEWRELAPPPPPGGHPVEPGEARARLAALLGTAAEARPGQADYASAVCHAFAPREHEGEPNVVLAEAGTGVGKTLGYIAPASLWSEKNEAPVWISTYTRNLQHQIDGELDRLFPTRAAKQDRVVLRKGRENYLCLLNYEEAVRSVTVDRHQAVPLGLIARWAGATRDGDMSGGDYPSWLGDILGARRAARLTDRRGECIYSACTHYSRCYIERGVRRARHADMVIANHALVMVLAARGQLDAGGRATRLIFDEGHHLFDAADSAFSARLTGLEAAELRRWIRGSEGREAGRARGVRARLEDLASGDAAAAALDDLARAATVLPAGGWRQRCVEGRPAGPTEALLGRIRQQVYARAAGVDGPYGLEAPTDAPVEGVLEAAADLRAALERISEPAKRLARTLAARLEEEADELDTATRNRLEANARALQQRCVETVGAWMAMLDALGEGTPPAFVDWFAVDRIDGRDIDIGVYRHWVDPTLPLAEAALAPAHGVLVTSATLTDGSDDPDTAWDAAERRTGARYLPAPPLRATVASPFDYPAQTCVFIVNDLRKDELGQVAAAYRELFRAAGGGALGLFTAVARLRAVHSRIAAALEAEGLPLYAQHVDALNLSSLVEIFREEEDACLLGADAMRDGVDVPGRSLRLIVFDRVPWPRPTLLHKARRAEFGGRAHDETVTRLRLKQAFGRLVRRADDRGVFVLLDGMMPSRLLGAFPEGVEVRRTGLAEAIAATRAFLHPPGR